jgi:hypothetical protein
MDHDADAAKFTGQTLAWFDEGEAQAASERDTIAELRGEPSRLGRFLVVLVLLAAVGFASVLVAQRLGFAASLPWELSLPWE